MLSEAPIEKALVRLAQTYPIRSRLRDHKRHGNVPFRGLLHRLSQTIATTKREKVDAFCTVTAACGREPSVTIRAIRRHCSITVNHNSASVTRDVQILGHEQMIRQVGLTAKFELRLVHH